MKIMVTCAWLAVALAFGVQSQDWADDTEWAEYSESQAVCRAMRGHAPPASDRPSPEQSSSLRGCSSEALYYGIGVPRDPERARHCAFLEAEAAEPIVDRGPFAGRAMLMTIYANGEGAARDLDVAIHLACGVEGAPAERDGRVRHLAELRSSGWRGSDFDYCDDVTSGLAVGYCSAHNAAVSEAERQARWARLTAGWPAPSLAALARLRDAHKVYVDAHGGGEVDLGGTLRATMQIGAEERLREELLDMLELLAAGQAPPTGAGGLPASDAALNAAYRARLEGEFGDHSGSVTRQGVRAAQRAWLRYRDAFLDFAAVQFPSVPRDAQAAWLTELRTARLLEPE